MAKKTSSWTHTAILILAGIACGLIISAIFILPYRGKAAPYRPPPPPPPPPPCEEGGTCPPPPENREPDEPDEPSEPTPTPCTPNLCVFEETSCCISPMCILLGQTSADAPGTNRCPEAGSQIHITNMHTWVQDFLSKIYDALGIRR